MKKITVEKIIEDKKLIYDIINVENLKNYESFIHVPYFVIQDNKIYFCTKNDGEVSIFNKKIDKVIEKLLISCLIYRI